MGGYETANVQCIQATGPFLTGLGVIMSSCVTFRRINEELVPTWWFLLLQEYAFTVMHISVGKEGGGFFGKEMNSLLGDMVPV